MSASQQGCSGYAQAMVDQRPKYDNAVRKQKRRRKRKGGK